MRKVRNAWYVLGPTAAVAAAGGCTPEQAASLGRGIEQLLTLILWVMAQSQSGLPVPG